MRQLRRRSSLALAAFWAAAVLHESVSAAEIHWLGGSGLWTDVAKWEPILEGDPPQLVQRVPGVEDIAILSSVAQASSVMLPRTNQVFAVGGLSVESGATLRTNGGRLVVESAEVGGIAEVRGMGSQLHVIPKLSRPQSPAFEANSLLVSDGASVTIEGDADSSIDLSASLGDVRIAANGSLKLVDGDVRVRSLQIDPQGTLSGRGRMRISSSLINEGLISVPPQPRFQLGLLWLEGLPGSTIDLDGSQEAGRLIVDDGTDERISLFISGTLTDPFTGTVQVGKRDSLSLPQIADSSVAVKGGTLSVGSIESSSVLIDANTTLNVTTISGTTTRITSVYTTEGFFPVIKGNIQFLGGTLEVQGHLVVNGGMTVDSGAHLDLSDADSLNLAATDVNAAQLFTINQSVIDLDGDDEDLGIFVSDSSLVLNVDAIDDDGDGAFNGTLGLKGFGRSDLVVNVPGGWVHRGTIGVESTGVQSLMGSPVTIDGRLILSPGLNDPVAGDVALPVRLLTDTTFTENAEVRFSDVTHLGGDLQLVLQGITRIGGGSWTGQADQSSPVGTIVFDSPNVTITAPTSMSLAGVDLDGLEPGRSLDIQQPLTLNVARVRDDSSIDAGTVRIGPFGKLEINAPPEQEPHIWLAKNRFDFVGSEDAYSKHMAGTPVQLHGTVKVSGRSAWSARAEIIGNVELAEQARLRLDGGDTLAPITGNRILGGVIHGPGMLQASSGHGLTGFGRIESAVEFQPDTILAANLGTLTITGPILVAGTIGTANDHGTLNITRPWNTSIATEVSMNRGTLTGGAITNDGVLRGRGTIRAETLDNQGLLETKGANLILGDTLTISTRTRPDLDGSGQRNGQGTVRVLDGHLVVTTEIAPSFHGTLEIGGGYAFSLTRANMGLRLAPGTEDPGGTGDAGSLHLANGTIRGNFFRQASELTVTEAGGVIESPDIEFESTAMNTLAGDLLLRGDATIHAGAGFTGGGRLTNATNSSLSIQAGGEVGVTVANDGSFDFRDAVGPVSIHEFIQSSTGTLSLRLDELAWDRLTIGSAAALAGTLEVSLVDAFQPAALDEFQILATADGITGTFDNVVLPPLPSNLAWQLRYDPANVVLRVIEESTGLAGDFNGKGDIDQADLDLVLLNWGAAATLPPEGWINDFPIGNVDQDELDRVLLNWGSAAVTASSSAPVPELSTAVLCFLAFCTAAMMQRHRKILAASGNDKYYTDRTNQKGR